METVIEIVQLLIKTFPEARICAIISAEETSIEIKFKAKEKKNV